MRGQHGGGGLAATRLHDRLAARDLELNESQKTKKFNSAIVRCVSRVAGVNIIKLIHLR